MCAWVPSRFRCVQPFATLWTISRRGPLFMGFSGKNPGVSCHALLQGIFPTQGLEPISLMSPPLAGGVLYHYCHLGSPISWYYGKSFSNGLTKGINLFWGLQTMLRSVLQKYVAPKVQTEKETCNCFLSNHL